MVHDLLVLVRLIYFKWVIIEIHKCINNGKMYFVFFLYRQITDDHPCSYTRKIHNPDFNL